MANAAMQRIRIARISRSASARDPSALRAATGASKRRIGKLWRHSGEQDWRLVEGTKGIREAYHASYYAAFLSDPDGNRIEAACHDRALDAFQAEVEA
jgi:hypothetical protein